MLCDSSSFKKCSELDFCTKLRHQQSQFRVIEGFHVHSETGGLSALIESSTGIFKLVLDIYANGTLKCHITDLINSPKRYRLSHGELLGSIDQLPCNNHVITIESINPGQDFASYSISGTTFVIKLTHAPFSIEVLKDGSSSLLINSDSSLYIDCFNTEELGISDSSGFIM